MSHMGLARHQLSLEHLAVTSDRSLCHDGAQAYTEGISWYGFIETRGPLTIASLSLHHVVRHQTWCNDVRPVAVTSELLQ